MTYARAFAAEASVVFGLRSRSLAFECWMSVCVACTRESDRERTILRGRRSLHRRRRACFESDDFLCFDSAAQHNYPNNQYGGAGHGANVHAPLYLLTHRESAVAMMEREGDGQSVFPTRVDGRTLFLSVCARAPCCVVRALSSHHHHPPCVV